MYKIRYVVLLLVPLLIYSLNLKSERAQRANTRANRDIFIGSTQTPIDVKKIHTEEQGEIHKKAPEGNCISSSASHSTKKNAKIS